MIITYTFDTDKDEDRDSIKIFQQAHEMSRLIWEFSNNNKRRMEAIPDKKHREGYEMALDRWFELNREFEVREV